MIGPAAWKPPVWWSRSGDKVNRIPDIFCTGAAARRNRETRPRMAPIFALRDSTVADVVQACLRALPHIDGAAICIMADIDARPSVHTSDDVCAAIEDAQFLNAEGPCFRAFATDTPVMIDDMRAPQHLARWSGYAPAAIAAGAVAVAALSHRYRGLPVGVLDLYRRTAGEISDADPHTTGPLRRRRRTDPPRSAQRSLRRRGRIGRP
jgi:hypothetical protein